MCNLFAAFSWRLLAVRPGARHTHRACRVEDIGCCAPPPRIDSLFLDLAERRQGFLSHPGPAPVPPPCFDGSAAMSSPHRRDFLKAAATTATLSALTAAGAADRPNE